MRLYAHLLFAIIVRHARAATIPDSIVQELEEKLPSTLNNETKLSAEGDGSLLDLRNPGSFQQNSEQHKQTDISLSSLQQHSQETQLIFKKDFQDVIDGISNLYHNMDETNLLKLQSNIETLRENFSKQIQKLNETLQTLVKSKSNTRADFKKIERSLIILHNNLTIKGSLLSECVRILVVYLPDCMPSMLGLGISTVDRMATSMGSSLSSGLVSVIKVIDSVLEKNNDPENSIDIGSGLNTEADVQKETLPVQKIELQSVLQTEVVRL